MGDVADSSGAGLVAVLAVLAPVLAGAAAAIFLVVGYVLRVFAPDATVGEPLVTAGWVFAACAAVGVLIAAVGLLITALRNNGDGRGQRPRTRTEEVNSAREAWHQALLERGILPFLSEALANPDSVAIPPAVTPGASPASSGYRAKRSDPVSRTPHLGYSRPGFTSPGDSDSETANRPRYSSPDFSSPEFGGQDHRSN